MTTEKDKILQKMPNKAESLRINGRGRRIAIIITLVGVAMPVLEWATIAPAYASENALSHYTIGGYSG
jgi:hypothetical protein